MITYFILGIVYFGVLTFADNIGDEKKVGHLNNSILTAMFLGVYFILNIL